MSSVSICDYEVFEDFWRTLHIQHAHSPHFTKVVISQHISFTYLKCLSFFLFMLGPDFALQQGKRLRQANVLWSTIMAVMEQNQKCPQVLTPKHDG